MSGAVAELGREVLGSPLCTSCGACLNLCPYVVSVGDRIACVEGCSKDSGRCYRYCPRSGATGADVVADGAERDPFLSLGAVRTVSRARAVEAPDIPSSGGSVPIGRQHGGVVTALVVHALRAGAFETAVLSAGAGGVAVPVSAVAEAEVRAAAGSKFARAPTVAEVNRILSAGGRRVGVVALPCQATALRRMRDDTEGPPAPSGGVARDSVRLVVGLFCTWALDQRAWKALKGGLPGDAGLVRVDVPPPPAEVLVVDFEGGRRVEIPLEVVRSAVPPACRVCADMTAEHADVSVGMAEGHPGWNTLIVRTCEGERLVAEAADSGMIELQEPDAARVEHLAGAALGKKRRAVSEAQSWDGDAPYLRRLRTGIGGMEQ